MTDELKKAHEIAGQIAITEMLRVLIASVCQAEEGTAQQEKLAKFEALVVNAINSRRHFADANDQTELYIKESASGFVSRLVASINIDARQ